MHRTLGFHAYERIFKMKYRYCVAQTVRTVVEVVFYDAQRYQSRFYCRASHFTHCKVSNLLITRITLRSAVATTVYTVMQP